MGEINLFRGKKALFQKINSLALADGIAAK